MSHHHLSPEQPWSSMELAGFIASLPELPRHALDIGCGTGGDVVYLAEQGIEAVGVDVSADALRVAHDRAARHGVEVEWFEASALDLPLLDDSIDLASDRGCLHHVAADDRPQYAREVARVLRVGGTLLLRDMDASGSLDYEHSQEHAHGNGHGHGHEHEHGITEPEIRAMIAGTPLQVVRIVPFGSGSATGTITVLRRG